MTSIEDFTSQYGLVQKIDAFGYLDYLKSNPDAPRKHGKVVLVTADTPLKASRGEGKTTTTIALIDAGQNLLFCWQMNRQAIWTPKRVRMYWDF